MLIIRQETAADYKEVYELVKAAFATTDFSDGSEPDYLNDIRERNTFIPELSLVAEENNTIVGQIVLYQMKIKTGKGEETQLVLSPLSVLPSRFHQGIGTALINEGCSRAKELGYKAVFLCGNPAYYSRHGFVPSYKYNIFHINDTERNAKWCMVKELVEGFIHEIEGSIIDIE